MNRVFAACALLLILVLPFRLSATHNRAGEITYRHISGYTYEITVLTYTFTPSLANRDSLPVFWGDGSPMVYVQIDQKVFLPNNVRYNTYVGVHTYPGSGTYIISMEDPNRNAGVVNIPGSVNQAFYIETMLVINPFIGPNSSPQLLAPPLDNACVGHPFIHNPTAFDPDGDSLSYSIIVCKGAGGQNITQYTYPQASVSLGIDPVSGDFLWDSPIQNGDFNIAILIEEWRFGVRIGFVIRDMQIFVASCNNQPPVIVEIRDTCVIVGETLVLAVTATDAGNQITLSASGGPLVLPGSPATFPTMVGYSTVTGMFQWTPDCDAVRKQPHLVSFKAVDNGVPVNLFDLESVYITVIAPAPDTLEVFPVGNTMVVDWSVSPCPRASGYSLYRKAGPSTFVPGPCVTGVPSWTGFQKIATLPGLNNTFFVDDDNGNGLVHGLNYCYRVVADFPDGAQSLASVEACSALKRDAPVITHISVIETDQTNGAILIDWVAPTEIDTMIAPGPYKYLIYRSPDGLNYSLVDSLSSLADTSYVDAPVNSRTRGYFYRIDLYNDQPGNRFRISSTSRASSVFVVTVPQDQRVDLAWDPVTPWVNTQYVIYRRNPVTMAYDSIGSTKANTFTDLMLSNGAIYCYLIRSTGTYASTAFPDPLLNFSQIVCAVPYDNVGPCPPELTVFTDCITNTLSWGLPPDDCGGDVAGYEVWYSPSRSAEYTMIHVLQSPYDTIFMHQVYPASVIGCYQIRSVDSAGNAGPFSSSFCIDSCDLYKIPNVFTPNGDGFNDLLIPFPYSNVERINLSMVSRWGNQVFATTDPQIEWDGTNQNTGEPLSAGVYYYVCEVWFFALDGNRKQTLSGIVHLLR